MVIYEYVVQLITNSVRFEINPGCGGATARAGDSRSIITGTSADCRAEGSIFDSRTKSKERLAANRERSSGIRMGNTEQKKRSRIRSQRR